MAAKTSPFSKSSLMLNRCHGSRPPFVNMMFVPPVTYKRPSRKINEKRKRMRGEKKRKQNEKDILPSIVFVCKGDVGGHIGDAVDLLAPLHLVLNVESWEENTGSWIPMHLQRSVNFNINPDK